MRYLNIGNTKAIIAFFFSVGILKTFKIIKHYPTLWKYNKEYGTTGVYGIISECTNNAEFLSRQYGLTDSSREIFKKSNLYKRAMERQMKLSVMAIIFTDIYIAIERSKYKNEIIQTCKRIQKNKPKIYKLRDEILREHHFNSCSSELVGAGIEWGKRRH